MSKICCDIDYASHFNRPKKFDSAGGIDSQDFNHVGLAGFKIDRAVNVQALTTGRLIHGNLDVLGRPASHRSRAVGGMYRVRKHHRFVGGERS